MASKRRVQPFGLPLARSLYCQAADVLLIPRGPFRVEVAEMTDFGGDPAQCDEDFPLQPVFRRPKATFVKFAPTEMGAIRQNGNLLNGSPQRKSHNGMAGFVVSGRFIVVAIHRHSL